MKKWNKVLALILALAVAVSNLPMTAFAAISSAAKNPTPQSTGMRMRQTGFDPETGILTMSLEVKTEELGQVGKDEDGFGTYSGRFPSELYFAFQVDTQSVEPVTADGNTVINVGHGRIGFVGQDSSSLSTDSFLSAFLNPQYGMGEQVSKGFNTSMGTDGRFAEDYSGYFTSLNRSETYLDCYLHLQWNANYSAFEEAVDEDGNSLGDGYVKAIDLYFQCYSGDYDSEGNRKKATTDYGLFCNSICLPGGVITDSSSTVAEPTEHELTELRDQFVVYKNVTGATTQSYLAVGVAGFTDAEREDGMSAKSRAYYGYGMKPMARDWLKMSDKAKQVYADAAEMSGAPELEYNNQEKEYIILGFDASFTNTVSNDKIYDETSDFYNPTDVSKQPQYTVPYYKEMDSLIEAEKNSSIWQPKAHYIDETKYVPLRYNLTTKVSSSSLTKPELVADTNNVLSEEFLKNIRWEFALKETDEATATPLDRFYTEDKLTDTDPATGEKTKAYEVVLHSDVYPHTYQVQEMYINDSTSNYNGCKVQTVQETTAGLTGIDTGVHVTPVGVMLDFSEKTKVSYDTLNPSTSGTLQYQRSEEKEAYAPQLRIDARAGDAESYLWLSTLGTGVLSRKGRVYLMTTYEEPNDGNYTSVSELAVQLHCDDTAVPTFTTVEMDEAYLTSSDENTYAFKVEDVDSQLSGKGIQIKAELFDQYGAAAVNNGERIYPNLILSGENMTGEQVALAARFDTTENAYYLIYKQTKEKFYDGNNLLAGKYTITASYNGVADEDSASIILNVTKDPAKFSYMNSKVNLTSSTGLTNPGRLLYRQTTDTYQGKEIQKVALAVPPKTIDANGAFTSHSVKVTIDPTELANQWRDKNSETQVGGADYDVIAGLRDGFGEFKKDILRANFTFTYTWEDKDGRQLPMNGVSIDSSTLNLTGSFTYDSTAGNGTRRESTAGASDEVLSDPLYVTVQAARKDGDPDEVQTNRYCFTFAREIGKLTTIKGSYKGSEPSKKEVQVSLEVPEAGKTNTGTVVFAPYNQYDDMMDWKEVNTATGEWQMNVDAESIKDNKGNKLTALPAGITLTGNNQATISVEDNAVACSFDVYATYGGMNSSKADDNNGFGQKIHVVVSKAMSVPTSITMNSDVIQIQVPSKGEASEKATPKFKVKDQYGAEMQAADYKMKWSFILPDNTYDNPGRDAKVKLNENTGEVTVEACAETWQKIAMRVRLYDKNGALRDVTGTTVYRGLQILRNDPPEVTTLSVTTETIAYPLLAASDRTVLLQATAETEYGQQTDSSGIAWVLKAVTYQNGDTASNIAQSSGVYTDENKVVSLNAETGALTFGNSVTNLELAPTSITVVCGYGEMTSEPATLPITYGGAAIASVKRVPSEVKIDSALSAVIKIPTGSEPNKELALDAQVSDQYGFVIRGESLTNVPCQWQIVDAQTGVKLEKTGSAYKLVVDSYAGNGSVTLKASYTQDETTVSNEITIGMGREPSVPMTMTPLSVGTVNFVNDAAELAMPGFTGPRDEDAVPATYTLKAKVEDGNHVHLTAQTIQWTVENDTYNIAKITNNNKLTLKNTAEWVKAGSRDNVTITLRATDTSAPGVTKTVTLTLKKELSVGAYAMPKLETSYTADGKTWPVYSDESSLPSNTYLLIPSIEDYENNGEQPYEAYFSATVYDQYRVEYPNHPVTYGLRNPNDTQAGSITGLTIAAVGTDKAVLKISTNVDINMSKAWVVAMPTGEHGTMVDSVNKCDVLFDVGSSYAAGLALGSDYYAQDSAEQQQDLPTWNPGTDSNLVPTAETYRRYELKAFVHNQRGANYGLISGNTAYPVWALGEDTPDGVTLVNPTSDPTYNNQFDTDGNAKGETLYVWVSSKAVAAGETSKEITISVWANDKQDKGDAYKKEITLTLNRGNATPTYVYFNQAKSTAADGAGVGDTIARPTADAEPAAVEISTVVFDSYGQEYQGADVSITIHGATLPGDVEVEDVTAGAARAVESTVEPVLRGQKIMRGETELAELVLGDNGTAELIVFGTCDLEEIELELRCGSISGSKLLRLPISQQTRTAKKVAVYELDEQDEPKEVIGDSTNELIVERSNEGYQLAQYYSTIFDQYNEQLSSDKLSTYAISWKLEMPGTIEGSWVAYEEQDEDGNAIENAERFLQYVENAGALTLMLNPEKYSGEVKVRVTCNMAIAANEQLVDSRSFELTLRRRSSSSSSSASGAYTITYVAGEHGKIISQITSELVLEGTAPKLVPVVEAEAGYAHRGWLANGTLVTDPGTMKVYSDMTLVANYITLKDHVFVSGYGDGTVRPNNNVTRGEFVRMLVGAATSYKGDGNDRYANVFSDIDEDAYYRDYAAYAYFYGIVSGYEDGTFRPEDPITRAEAASMIAKAKSITPASGVTVFKDLSPDAWYTGYAEALGREKILSGYEDGTFRPENNLTRAEAITMLVRISDASPSEREAEQVRKTAEVTFKDVDRKFWAFPYIARAAGVA